MHVRADRLLLLMLTTMTVLAAVAGQGPTWGNPGIVPPGRNDHGLVYDEGRGRLVVFGGVAQGLANDTWEHDGASWIRRTPAVSPPARFLASFAHDPIRGVSVVIGGINGSPLADAWQWDGESWTQLPPGPSAPFYPLLFWHGGTNAGLTCMQATAGPGLQTTFTTFRWDGTTWQNMNSYVASNGPSSGSGAYVPTTGRSYALTGTGIWSWDGSSWQAVAETGATLSDIALSIVWDEARARLVVVDASGGTAATYVGNLSSPLQVDWTIVSNINPVTGIPAPTSRFGARVAYDSRRQQCVLFGGNSNGTKLDDMWTLEFSPTLHWQLRPNLAASPTDRVYTDMAFEATSGRMVLFGGNDIGGARNDTWTFDGVAWTDHGPSALVSPRAQPALCYAPNLGIVMFGGGVLPTTYFNDTWILSGSQWLTTFVSNAPAPRMGHDMVWASGWNRVVMFGGYNGSTLSDTWSLTPSGSGVQWTPMVVSGLMPPRQSHAMAFDARRNRLVLFGGADANGQFAGETWEMIQTTRGWQWIHANPTQSPPRRWQHKMDYDPARGVVVMIGGYGNPQCGNFCASHLSDVWEYDGDTWTQRTPSTSLPAGREGAGFAYDTVRQRFVLQGGSGNGVFTDETWYYSAPNDRFAQGMLGGGTMQLRCTRFPVAGQPTGFAFDSPNGIGWLSVFIGPSPQGSLTLGPGILCGTGTIYGLPLVLVHAMGFPSRASFTLPASTVGLGFVAQGISLDNGSCLSLTDPLAVTIHAQ